jgi:hypothetical protein
MTRTSFLSSTLAFLRGRGADLHLQAHGRDPRPLSGAVPDVSKPRPSSRPPRGVSRSDATSLTGAPWTPQRAPNSRNFSARTKASSAIRARWSASSRSPERDRAVGEFRDVLEKGYTDAKGVLRKPLVATAPIESWTALRLSVNSRPEGHCAKQAPEISPDRSTRRGCACSIARCGST